MKPYYEDAAAGITLFHCRAEELLATLAPQSVDLVLTDPPYAEETHAGARTAGHRGWVDNQKKDIAKLVNFDCFTAEDLRFNFDAIGRVARAWVLSFMDWRHIYLLEKEPPTGLRFVRFGVWVKPNGAPQYSGDRPGTGWEGIAFLHRTGGKMVWHGGGRVAVFSYNVENQFQREGDHPTNKPKALVKELITLFSNSGDLVCDPFLGSGTTARACKDLGRRFVGCDISEAYLEIAVRRLRQEVLPLWDATGEAGEEGQAPS